MSKLRVNSGSGRHRVGLRKPSITDRFCLPRHQGPYRSRLAARDKRAVLGFPQGRRTAILLVQFWGDVGLEKEIHWRSYAEPEAN